MRHLLFLYSIFFVCTDAFISVMPVRLRSVHRMAPESIDFIINDMKSYSNIPIRSILAIHGNNTYINKKFPDAIYTSVPTYNKSCIEKKKFDIILLDHLEYLKMNTTSMSTIIQDVTDCLCVGGTIAISSKHFKSNVDIAYLMDRLTYILKNSQIVSVKKDKDIVTGWKSIGSKGKIIIQDMKGTDKDDGDGSMMKFLPLYFFGSNIVTIILYACLFKILLDFF